MKTISFIFIYLFTIGLHAQKRNNVWCFGDSAGIDFNQVVPLPVASNMDSRGSCTSISDTSGRLQFYASTGEGFGQSTTKVRNENGQVIQNGDSIRGRGWYNELTIIPTPGSDNMYYLFSLGVTTIYGFYYSVIDMSLNGGLGAVIEKNVLVDSYKAWDAMAAVKHGNGRDWWIITKNYNTSQGSDSLYIYLVTPDGIEGHVQEIGDSVLGGMGNMVFNRDGSRFLFTAYNGMIETMNFDRCTGVFSNATVIYPFHPLQSMTGSAFSPNGDVMYYATGDVKSYLIQLDLTATNIWASRDTLVTLDAPFEAAGFLRLAPDNKIYWSCAWTNGVNFNYPYQDTMYHTENTYLSVINDPDVVGSGCNLSMYSFYLGGKRCYWGLPNNPDYDLGPVVGSICDSLSSGISEPDENSALQIFPNPTIESSFVNGLPQGIIEVQAINLLSQTFPIRFEKQPGGIRVFTTELPPGFYLLRFKTINKQFAVKLAKARDF